MTARAPSNLNDLLDVDNGRVSARIFQDEDIYADELAKIFARCWLYLGHESQIDQPGDYIAAEMGEDPVVVVRNPDGEVRAFLNSCRHRGAKLCRTDQGNSKALRCPYHGWTYALSGDLIGVPRRRTAYFDALDRDPLGLIQVPQLDTYQGMIFATWDPHAPSLPEYLGEFTAYLDLMLGRSDGGVEVIGGVHKWVIETNWKIPAENFSGDQYHLSTTHGSSVEVGLRNKVTDFGHSIYVTGGHSLVRERGGAQQGSAAVTEYTRYIDQVRKAIAEEKGEKAAEFVPVGVGTIFPNLSFMDSVRFRTLRLWQPRGPHRIDVNSWCLVDRGLSPKLRKAAMEQYVLSFGPSGMFEQDDGEVWTAISEGTRGYIGRQTDFNYEMGLGRERAVSDAYGVDMPGMLGEAFMTEGNQRAYYRRWQQLMEFPVSDGH